ncbi:plac8 [Tritrichomonas musculus]|uniref:Plac8 n=1 Tax=Tritrichomonas musculus TaxID=1915356 RepID=A0ABR2HXH6_9EUKA
MNNFSTGLFDCFSDCAICVYTFFCPSCALSDNWAQSRNEDCSICHFCAFAHPIWTRDNIRVKLGQREKQYVSDFIIYSCCTLCAICQDARELKHLKGNVLLQEHLVNQGNISEPIATPPSYSQPDPSYQQPVYVVQPGYPSPPPVFQDQGYPQQPPQ